MNLQKQLGIYPDDASREQAQRAIRAYLQIKLKALGLPGGNDAPDDLMEVADPLIAHYREQFRMLQGRLCPADQRIQDFLNRYFSRVVDPGTVRIPAQSLTLDRHGLARELSLPEGGDYFKSPLVESYRIQQGVLHNPVKDRRTTQGVFHVAEGGLPIPDDKKAVPLEAAARVVAAAMAQPDEIMELPYHAGRPDPARTWVSLLLRPLVCPEVPGYIHEKRMEVRFFAPAGLISNLDFVESIFGNAADPYLSENDAALDALHWTGHTGCVILAPHLTRLTKKGVGLPHISDATERQKRDAMCWEQEDEPYNDGTAFKLTCRDASGTVVTVIADNYFGYCKKEVKTQISFSANLYGLAEEEHAGGALVFPAYDLGEDFKLSRTVQPDLDHDMDDAARVLGDALVMQPAGFGIDRNYPDIVYLPSNAEVRLETQSIRWEHDAAEESIRIEPDKTYLLPSGYKVDMIRPHEGRRWRLQGTCANGIFCHKPCTVSGGGKSEISKSLADAIITGPMFVKDFKEDFDLVEEILERDYTDRFRDPSRSAENSRPVLSEQRSLGSVIKLLTPSPIEYSDEYNAWVESIPEHVKSLVITVKRFHKQDWEGRWRERFSVDTIDGRPGKELRYRKVKIATQYLRVGYLPDGSWRIFNLRKDFLPSVKLSMEDDITASVVAPIETIPGIKDAYGTFSLKYAENCENRFFQRPDDAIIRGYDKQAEADLSAPGSFLSNYQPLDRDEARDQAKDVIRFEEYTEPVRKIIHAAAEGEGPDFFCSPANPRVVDGKPTKNPRYLQVRPDHQDPRSRYLAETGIRLYHRIAPGGSPMLPVSAVLPGRRNNPADPAAAPPLRPLCCYGPVHYLELPELFMEYISSLTGKSPSTTGAGSEGALTKAPFNALLPIHDLNNALVSGLLTGTPAFLSSAGNVGPNYRVDHDISLLMPEVFSRMQVAEQDPEFLIREGHLEKLEDFEHNGTTVRASRLGYRITARFARIFFGRMFTNPTSIFPDDMLKPELQDMDTFADSVANICEAHERVAAAYFRDGSIDKACPPLKALLTIMAKGEWEGKDLDHPEVRSMFTRDALLGSDWYQDRLKRRQKVEVDLWQRHVSYLEEFMARPHYQEVARSMDAEARLREARATLSESASPQRIEELTGTLGTDTFE